MSSRRFRSAATALVILALASTAAAGDPGEDGAPGLLRWFDVRTSPFILIPEVGTDPNSGTTYGLLPVYLVRNEEQQITRLYAPDLIYHPRLGYGARFRVFGYPSSDTEWHVVGGGKERIEREFDVLYSTGITRSGPWSLSNRLLYDRSATPRFFGIGNDTSPANEANFTQEQAYYDATLAGNLTPDLQISVRVRPRLMKIEPGVLEQSISRSFQGNENDWLNELAVSYDTRDSPVVPTRGTEITTFAGFADRHFLSSISYSVFGLDVRHIETLTDKIILASHAALRYMPGATARPFWALSRLGGDKSVLGEQQPLRGFGEGRFVDNHLFSTSVELRTPVFDLDLFGQQVTFEAAPFIDAGQVFHHAGDNPISRLHVAGGLGFRVIARPFIVGYVDIGYGGEGVAVFSGIAYPF